MHGEDVIENFIHLWSDRAVSPLSFSKGTGVSGGPGPHTLLTASLVAVTSERGAAMLPLTIISLATLPFWRWWRPWTNTAIWIQLAEWCFCGLACKWGLSRAQASRKLKLTCGHFNFEAPPSLEGKKWQNYWNRCSGGSVALARVMDIKL